VSTTYRFGPVTLRSTVELPELPSVSGSHEPAVTVTHAELLSGSAPDWYHQWVGADGRDWLRIGRDERGYRLEFPGLAEFALSNTCSHVAARPLHVSPQTFRHLLLDQVLPLVLAHQGWCVLHAAAIATRSGAAAFVGSAGLGKSTMTASFARAGLPAIADDTLILTAGPGGNVVVHPAYPSLRVWPDTADAVAGPDYRDDGRVSEFNDKVRVGQSAGFEFATAGAALRAIYMLTPDADAGAPAIEAIPPRDRILEIVRHAFVLDWKGIDRLRAAFETVSRVADGVAVRRLRFRHDYAGLPAVRRAVLEDLQLCPN
jgi:hypothetical protein